MTTYLKVIIEMPMGSNYKYESKEGKLILDRVINQNIPYNYGYIPYTLCGDGDPLDVFIISHHPILPGTVCEVEVLGAYNCIDNGDNDDKVIAILKGENLIFPILPFNDPIYKYLTTYKEGFQVEGWLDRDTAFEIIEAAQTYYFETKEI